jgi:hypothetical protein
MENKLEDFYRLRFSRRTHRLTRIGENLPRSKPAGWPDYVRARRLKHRKNIKCPPPQVVTLFSSLLEGSRERNQASQRVSRAEGIPLFESTGVFGAKTVTDKNLPFIGAMNY